MNHFDIDWTDFIQRLSVWEQLSLNARQAFATLRPNEGIATSALEGRDQLLVGAEFVEYYAARRQVRLSRPCIPFSRAIRAMVRHDILAKPDAGTLTAYLRDHFSTEEIAAASGGRYYYGYNIEHELAPQVMSVGWVERLLSEAVKPTAGRVIERALPAWLRPSKQPQQQKADPEVTRRLVRHLMELPEPVPLAELPNRWDDVPVLALGPAIRQAVERLVLFPAMRRQDMTPVLGLWPAILRRLHRPKLKAPGAVTPQTVFHGAVLVEDMTAVLAEATARPLRLRGNDFALFAKAQQELEAGLMSVPQWIVTSLGYSPQRRVPVAVGWLQMLGLACQAGKQGKDLRIEATRKGQEWLAETAKRRLQVVLNELRSPSARGRSSIASSFDDEDDWNREDSWDDEDELAHYAPTVTFLPGTVQIPGSNVKDTEVRLRQAMVSAFGVLPGEEFVPMEEFVAWQAQESNPLVELMRGDGRSLGSAGWSYRPPTDEELERAWARLLDEMIRQRLMPLGGARWGMVEGVQGACFALTGAGRYLLGLAEDFDYGHESEAQGQIVVQPNFEVVFLAPSPLAEAALARFAARKGRGVGALFTITKKSILAAAGSGMTAEQALETVQRLSAKPVPANVAREISGWFDQCRRIQVRQAVLIHCPDADTAARVVAASGKRARLLTDTVVELTNTRAKTELLRKLHALGIFVARSAPEP